MYWFDFKLFMFILKGFYNFILIYVTYHYFQFLLTL